jgi:hypothetical protein
MKMYLPANLDVSTLLKEHPPTEIKNFNRDKLVYILGLINHIPAKNKSLITKIGFVSICTRLLQRKVRNYKDYFEYLIKNGILICDNHFIPNIKAKGYKFTPPFEKVSVKPEFIFDNILIKNIKKYSAIPPSIEKKYKHVFKCYNEFVELDYYTARAFIEADLKRKIKNPALCDLNKEGDPKDPYTQYKCALQNLDKIKDEDFALSVDKTVHRLHSVFTNISSPLRNCISFGGRKLVSIDVKNSQPYILIGLLQTIFWEGVKIDNNDSFLYFTDIYNKSFKNIFNNNNKLNSFVILVKKFESQADSDLQRYKKLVLNGTLYEYLGNEFAKELGGEIFDKKTLKKIVFQVLFTDNRFLGSKDAVFKRTFKKLFPQVYQLICLIKKIDSTNLPRLLQTIESHLILKVITKRIARERRNLTIFTIHDSIVTTDELDNVAYVQRVMEEEFTKAIGFPPKLALDKWDITDLKFSDGTPFHKEMQIAV